MSLSSAPLGSGEQPTLPRTPAAPRSTSASPAASAATTAARPRRLLGRLLDRYPELPPPLEGTGARVAFWSVVAIAAIWVIFYTVYLWATHDAYLTHAEDMATMTQALWTTTHGAFLHQTVCNIIGDTNCLGDVSRFAIHFEPIMLPLALLYALIPSAKLLQFVQVVVVAAGALPAYWLASRRLRHPLAGVAFALLYLLYPPLQSAVTYDFHAVTLSAAFLMFALYFMMTRNDLGLVIACLLALATKEEIPIDVFMIGLSVALLQRRWKTGGGLVALSLVWLVGALLIMRAASPLGYSPTAGRYAALGSSPTQVALTLLTRPLMVVRTYVLSHDGVFYLRTLLSPLGYLPALSPWALLISGPALAINLLSNDPSMRAGIYQYNAEIAPVMVFAAIDAVAWLSAAAGWLARRAPDVARRARGLSERLRSQIRRVAAWPWARIVMAALTLFAFAFGAYEQRLHGDLPIAEGFTWPTVDAHTALANRFVAMVPPDASVSGQSDLLPHLSNRRYVYLFPYQMLQADYVLLDVTGNIYPQTDRAAYASQVLGLLANPDEHVIAAQDGYLLFKRGPGPKLSREDPLGLPESFYSFTKLDGQPQHTTDIRYGPTLDGATLRLVGYSVSPAPTLYLNNPYLTVTTYWQASAQEGSIEGSFPPLGQPGQHDYHIEVVLKAAGGAELVTSDFATTEFRPMNTWGPDVTYVVTSGPILVTSALGGQVRIGVRVLAGPPDDTLAPALPAQASAPGATVTDRGALGVFTSETIAK
ncbi:MAG TPA: DUF2079 domain-containing protein [Ktedonobacterales bacterium]|nr:DUF2079 domain-containing protein [Ktedonobacterales bacterium]